jgi:hypothetical protein
LITDVEVETPAALVVVFYDRDAVIDPQRADGQIKPETDSDIRGEVAYSIVIGIPIHKARIVKYRDPHLFDDWNGIFYRETRERLAP